MPFPTSQSLQELYLDCRSEDLSQVGNLRAYLFRTAQNLLFDHYRSQSVRNAAIADWPEPTLPDAPDLRCAETVVLGEQALDSLIGALAELSPLCQRIFYLNRFEGLKQREIAEQLDVSVRTVEDNIKRALLHCAKTLGQP